MIRQKKRTKMNFKTFYGHKSFDPKFGIMSNEALVGVLSSKSIFDLGNHPGQV